MNLEDLIPSVTREALAKHGLHKVAGAMYGVDELGVKEAAQLIGAKAYLRRKEARVVVTGIAALAAANNEKLAENPAIMALLRRAAMPAALGAGIGGVTHALNDDPNKGSPLKAMAAGGLLGGLGGAAHSLNKATSGQFGTVGDQLAMGLNSYDTIGRYPQ